jgi:hypothetical protein
MLLLNASALVVVRLAQGALRSLQATQLTTASWALAAETIESAAASRCTPGAVAGSTATPRVTSSWIDHVHTGWHDRSVHVAMVFSPLAGTSPAPLAVQAGWSCP